jgi:tagatose 1,6-diphosphate aldolase
MLNIQPHPLASALPPDGTLRLVLQRLLPPAEASWKVATYLFDIVAGRESVGRLSLRIGDTPVIREFAGHLGLGIDPAHRGQGYARRSARLIVPLARAHGLDPMWISCDPDNEGSIRAILSLGASYVDTVTRGEKRKRRYRLDLQ